MPQDSLNISVTAPLAPAFARMKALLFQPFNFQTWLLIGFCAWLDQLDRFGGGGGTGFRFGDHRGAPLQEMLREAREFFLNNFHWLVPVLVAAAIVGLGIWLLITWLSSRGQFMFLDNVATGRPAVVLPWSSYGRHGDSLFVFRAILGLLAAVVIVPSVLVSAWMISQLVAPEGGRLLPIIGILFIGIAGIGVGLALLIVQKLTRDFVVPIMFLQTDRCLEGWRRFSNLLALHPLDFLIYLLFSIVIGIGTGLLVVALVIVTCCCAGCLLAIPFLGTLLLLPVRVFTRAYSALYLAQYGSQFDIFTRLLAS